MSGLSVKAAASPIAFYDAFLPRLLKDYLLGNARAEAAISTATAWLPRGAIEILDIGCGIGWSTAEFARRRPSAEITGVDLSLALIGAARSLFGDSGEGRITFDQQDFLSGDGSRETFDVITLLDVYEHFPLSARDDVHERLSTLLKSRGRLVLATPTVSHQEFLRRENPRGLQPIDEDVTREDLQQLADAVRGRLVLYKPISVWRANDYQHAVIDRGEVQRRSPARPRLEPKPARALRVERVFGLRWTPRFGFVAARGSTKVFLATRPLPQTQTFVRSHAEDLPARLVLPEDCRLPSFVSGAVRATARALGKDEYGVEDRVLDAIPANVRLALLARQLRRSKIAVVLAEFGTTAAEVYPACRRAGIPLVTHFHGYDAFVYSVIERYGATYAEIFSEGWPVVAVSESMRRQLVRLGAAPDQVSVIRYGIDLDRFRPQTPTPGLVVAAGRFVEKKAPELVVRAFARAAAAAPHAQLVMIGDGPLRPQLERLITQLGVDDRVTLAGERDHAWVAEVVGSASVFVQHSVVAADGDREGTPVAVLEAAAAGVPVVATSHEGIAEVVANRETGLLVEERDVEGMADALVALLLDPVRARRLGLSGRAQVEALCSREQSIAELWAVLERAIAQQEAN